MRLNLCCFYKKIWKVFVKWGKFAAKLEFGLAFYNNKIKAFPFSRKLHLIFKITNCCIMKNWQKVLAFVFMAAVLMLEACHRGYGCPGADL